jgi:hypothetical protein
MCPSHPIEWSNSQGQPLSTATPREESMLPDASCRLSTARLAAALAVLLALSACAESATTPAAPSTPAGPQSGAPPGSTIIWNSDRAEPSSSQPQAPGAGTPAPGQSSGSAGAASPPPASHDAGAPAPPPEDCREFTETVTIGGRPQQAHGRTCRQPDGTWRVERPTQMPQLPVPSATYSTAAPYPAGPSEPATGGSVFFGTEFRFADFRYPH